MVFNGKATVYSTCRDCGTLMQVVNATTHPTCKPRPTKVEALAQGWLATVLHGDAEAERLTAQEITEHDATPPQLAKAAVWYARWGWPVFPLRPVGGYCDGAEKCVDLCQCPKKPFPRSGGFKDAVTNVADIQLRWRNNPTANIGLATGHLFDVVDIDPRHGGVQSFLELVEHNRLPDIHGIAATASGGMHLYIKPTGKSNSAGWMPGLDHRGLGGYVVAPPSTLGASGRNWSWVTMPSPRIKVSR